MTKNLDDLVAGIAQVLMSLPDDLLTGVKKYNKFTMSADERKLEDMLRIMAFTL